MFGYESTGPRTNSYLLTISKLYSFSFWEIKQQIILYKIIPFYNERKIDFKATQLLIGMNCRTNYNILKDINCQSTNFI